MRRSTLLAPISAILWYCGAMSATGAEDTFLRQFETPPAEYHTGPLWVWNDDITEAEIDQQLDMFASQRVLQPFVHPRPGLITPYLSARWLALYKHAVESAKKRGMLLHIYDENSYPSGFAGGHVPARHPEWTGKGMVWEKVEALPSTAPEDLIAAYRLEGNSYVRIEGDLAQAKGPGALVRMKVRESSPWNGGFPYVDLLEPGLTEEFLKVTLDPYKQTFGNEFGKTVRHCFTDEPHLRATGSLHWSRDLAEQFKARCGYDLLASLPSLFEDSGDFRKVRYDYFQLLLDLFIERWAKPYYDECARNNLNFTGHYWEHEWPRPPSVPDNMAMAAWQQMPGIDCLMNQYNEGVHAQFGNVRAVREIASVANQLGRARRLCEVYGAGGWEMTFEDQKRIADWLGVLGVNFFNQHLTYMTLRGPRKRDHPLSFSDHAPWWDHYHLLGDYIARLALALSTGDERNRVLVLEPTTSGWVLHQSQADNSALEQLGEGFQAFLTDLSLHQVEYDLGCEQVIRDHGTVEAKGFRVGERVYDLVVLHHTCANLGAPTFELLKQFAKNGGHVLLVGGRPKWIEGTESGELSELFPEPKEGEAIPLVPVAGVHGVIQGQDKIREYLAGYSSVRFEQQQGGKLFHQVRRSKDSDLLFLCNTSKEESASGKWLAEGKQVRILDLPTGKSLPCNWGTRDKQVEVAFELPPAGSALYLITNEESVSPKEPVEPKTTPAPLRLARIERSAPNVFPLDYCDYEVDGGGEKDVYFYRAQTALYKARGFDRNPWDSAVQFEDRVLARDAEFKEGSGFTVRYRFTVEGFATPPVLQLAVEQAHRYEFTLNGKPIRPNGGWWLDRKFELLDSGAAVVAGTNELVLTSRRFSVHCEVEPVYLLGEFSLESCDKGWVMRPARPLEIGPWKDQGMPFYGGGVRYVYQTEPNPGSNTLQVSLPKWEGVVAVTSDAKSKGLIAWPPYQIALHGEGEIAIEVIGSLKNILGPHHGNPSLGTAWPGQFQKGPETGPPRGSDYHTLPYGLMEPPAAVWVQ